MICVNMEHSALTGMIWGSPQTRCILEDEKFCEVEEAPGTRIQTIAHDSLGAGDIESSVFAELKKYVNR